MPNLEQLNNPTASILSQLDEHLGINNKFNSLYGDIFFNNFVELDLDETNILDKLHEAISGDENANKWLDINIQTAVTEAGIKVDHICTPIKVSPNINGNLSQLGQSKKSIYKNSLTLREKRHPILEEITKIEVINGIREEEAYHQGLLKDNYIIVISIVPDNVPEENLDHRGDGYFVESLSYSIQVSHEDENGDIVLESAFLPGVINGEKYNNFNDRIEHRHDIAALGLLYKSLNLSEPTSAVEFLNNPLKISKELLPNGILDFVLHANQAKDIVLGDNNEHKIEEYIALKDISRVKENSLKLVREKVKKQLIESVNNFDQPSDVVNALWTLTKNYLLVESLDNYHIDPRVFGNNAAVIIEQAREYDYLDQKYLVNDLLIKAQEFAVISGCGGGSGSSNNENQLFGHDDHGSLAFNCPGCGLINIRQHGILMSSCGHCSKVVSCV